MHRLVVLAACLIAVAAAVVAYRRARPIIQKNLAAKAMHDKCLAYVVPAGHIVYQEARVDLSRVRMRLGGAPPATRPSPSANQQLYAKDLVGMSINGSSSSWVHPSFLPNTAWGPQGEFTHVLFLHGRRVAGRPARLVYVEVNPSHPRADTERSNYYAGPRPDTWFILARVYQPAWLLSQGGQLSEQSIREIGDLPPPQFGISLLAGPIDAADESHFSILYKLSDDSHPMTIDGWLQPDDTVRFKLPSQAGSTQ